MGREVGLMMGLAAVIGGLLLCFSLEARPKTKLYRIASRVFWAFALVQIGSALGGPGANLCTMAAAGALGLPGYGAMLLLSAL